MRARRAGSPLPNWRMRISTAVRRCSCTGLPRRVRHSASESAANARATSRCSGTVTPMKRSPSPYSPGPVRKKRAEAAARAGLARAAKAFRTAAAVITEGYDENIRTRLGTFAVFVTLPLRFSR